MTNQHTDIPTSSITLNDITISQVIVGNENAPPVLILHGWGANLSLVWSLVEGMATKGYRVFALDLPGFGESDKPQVAWSVFDYANFAISYLDYHNLEQVHLFGHSFGGRLGLILGADHDTRIRKMVLADSAGLRPKIPLTTQVRTKTYKSIRSILESLGLRALSQTLREHYNKRYGSTDFQAVSGVMRETFVKVVNQDLLNYAARVTVPTLLIWGEDDQDTPLWMAKKLEETIPDAGLVTYPGAGHYSYLENLSQTIRIMDALFKQD